MLLQDHGWLLSQLQFFPVSVIVASKPYKYVGGGETIAVQISEFSSIYEGLYHLVIDVNKIEPLSPRKAKKALDS